MCRSGGTAEDVAKCWRKLCCRCRPSSAPMAGVRAFCRVDRAYVPAMCASSSSVLHPLQSYVYVHMPS
jgi:hypothetical protein